MIAGIVLALVCTPAGGGTVCAAALDEPGLAGPFGPAIAFARQRVVKLYGGGLGREKGYGSGIVVSPDGKIVTTLSILLEARALRVVLADGRRFSARVVARDQQRQLALLEIDAFDLPRFELKGSAHLRTGDWVIAAANPFKVADGPEPVSISVGVLSGRAKLDARRRRQDFAYTGPVLLTDVIVATPGSAGGALVDADGNLVGLIGKPVVSKRTNTWLNYALPVEQVAAFVQALAAEPRPAARAGPPDRARGMTPADLGIRLLDFGSRRPPPYVERVRPGSPAWRAGLRPDDLILAVAGEQAATCAAFRALLGKLKPGQRVSLLVKRRDEVKQFALSPQEPSP